MPDFSLLIASLNKPGMAKEPPLLPILNASAATPLSCEAISATFSPPDASLCPAFSPCCLPNTSRIAATSAPASIPLPEPTLPPLLPPQTTNPYLPVATQPAWQPHWTNYIRPRSGSQLYQQRLEALRQGKTYTRLPSDSFAEVWANASQQVTYDQWTALLKHEATAMVKGQGKNRLTVILGDSISQWLPPEELSDPLGVSQTARFYLNQGISGDTTGGLLGRLAAIDGVRADTIYVMVGVNDLKNGKTELEILTNLQKIMQRLRQSHPQAQVIVNSVLPTRLPSIASDRTMSLNQKIAQLAEQEGVSFLSLTSAFADRDGTLRHELTTDGLHLSAQGYAVWGSALRSIDAIATTRLAP
jgi:lysophospholipase L1-like esterase